MADKIHTPLPAPVWRMALRAQRYTCGKSSPRDEAGCVRALYELLLRAPVTARLGGVVLADAIRLERLIAAGACESAVLAMLGEGSGYIVSSAGISGDDDPDGGGFLATVALPGQDGETHAPGASLALALAAALVDAVIEANTARGALYAAATPILIH